MPKTNIDIEKEAAERFAADVAEHQMTVLRDDGLYRHLRFNQTEHAWNCWFELVTWPGALVIRGDHGSHTFARTEDMFTFFRRNGNSYSINPGYWAEKTPDYGKSVQVYSEDVLRANLVEPLAEYKKAYADRKTEYAKDKARYDAAPWRDRWPVGDIREPVEPTTPAEIDELIENYDENGELTHEDGARDLLRDLEKLGIVSDTWEWSLTDWDYHYLWCCHAIVWGIRQYDKAKPAAASTPGVEVVEIAGVTR